MTFFDWADRHWILAGLSTTIMMLGFYEVLTGLGKYFANKK
jgi:hypothetical protein